MKGRLATLVILLLLATGTIWAVVTGSISGTVTDPTGAVIPNAAVTARNTDTGIDTSTQTNAQGFYNFPALPPGKYEVTIKATGFEEYRETGLVLDVNNALRIDAAMKVGAVSQEVSVTSTAVHVETTNTQMGEVIGNTKMTTLPLNGRSYTDLLALQPGVAPSSSGEGSGMAVSGNLNPGALSVSGQREGANGFMVNGGNAEERLYNNTAIIPNLDSIAEFRIITSNGDAEFGGYSGGMINVITKQGTNQFHGDAFEFVRNPHLDSRNFFSPGLATLHQNIFGGTAGGPIKHDRLFFFADYQGTRLVNGVDTGLITVPSAQDHTGNLSDVAGQLTGAVNGTAWANSLTQLVGYPVNNGEGYFYGPGGTTCTSTNPTTGCVFPNYTIPQSAFSAPAVADQKFILPPNSGAYYTSSAYKGTLRDDKASARLDGNTRLGMVSGYYFIDDDIALNPYGGASMPGFASSNNGRAQIINLGITKALGATAVNELRLGYMRDVQFSNAPAGGVGTSIASQGFTGIFPMNPSYEGVMPMGFNNYSIGVANSFLRVYDNTYNFADNFSKVIGTHTVKFGGAFNYDQVEYRFTLNLNGSFGFNGGETGFDFADFLLGAPSGFSQGLQLPVYGRSRSYNLYGQDSWRATKNLTLNYGLRWEVSSPWWEAHNEWEALIPGCQSKEFPGSPVGWCFPGDPGIPSTLAPTGHTNFAPRLGFAYSPHADGGFFGKLLGGSGQTSIRGAWGVFFTSFENRILEQESGDAPYGYWWGPSYLPTFTNPYVVRTSGVNEGQRFPVPVPPLNISVTNPDTTLNWAQFVPLGSSPAFFHNNQLPYAEDYNFSLERQFGSATILSVSYVGTQGHRLLGTVEANPSSPTLCASLPGCGPSAEDAGPFTNAAGALVYTVRSPYNNVVAGLNGPTEAFASDGYMATMANSNYNALEVTVRRILGRAEFLLGYTYSKSLDNASGNGLGQGDNINPINPSITKSLSAFNVAQNLVVSYSYRLPFDKLGGPKRLTNGWALNGITRFATGFPVYILETNDYSMLGTGGTGQGNDIDEPNRALGSLNIKNPRTEVLPSSGQAGQNPYFNTALFSQEQLGQLGNSSRRFFSGPGWNNFDLSLTKEVHLTESLRMEFRAEFFNAWNHAQFGGPQGQINGNPTFGYVTGANSGRIGQIGAKFFF
ncbi:MAG TPA: carboxypeptidase regulatory-like domain-containing protein [Terriglobia bacterium]|nr:carboxypeptidase regulatory-like domain-containing protein [Terriglobia bacterium]